MPYHRTAPVRACTCVSRAILCDLVDGIWPHRTETTSTCASRFPPTRRWELRASRFFCSSIPRSSHRKCPAKPAQPFDSLRLSRGIHQIQQIVQVVLASARFALGPPAVASPPGVNALPDLGARPAVVVVVVGEIEIPEHLRTPRVARGEVERDGAIALVVVVVAGESNGGEECSRLSRERPVCVASGRARGARERCRGVVAPGIPWSNRRRVTTPHSHLGANGKDGGKPLGYIACFSQFGSILPWVLTRWQTTAHDENQGTPAER